MNPAQRRIPQQADESMTLVRGYTLNDAILFAPGVMLGMVTLVVVPPAFRVQGLMLAVLLLAGATIALKTTPDYYKPTEWVRLHAAHRARQSEYHHLSHNYDHAQRTQQDHPDQTFVQSVWATNQRTQDVLGITRIQPGGDRRGDTGYIQLDDDTLIGAVRVYPSNLSLSEPDEWEQAVAEFASVVNTVEFPQQIYRTAREFDTEQFLTPYADRRGDADVRSEPVLDTLLDEFLEWYPQRLAEYGTRVTEFYVIVPVDRSAVKSDRRTTGFKEQVAEWPVVGRVISTDDDEEIPETILRGRQRERLYDRLATLRAQLRSVPGVDVERVDAADHAALLARAYHREPVPAGTQLNTTGVTTRARADTEMDSEREGVA